MEALATQLYRAWIVARGFNPEMYPWTDLSASDRAVWIAVANVASWAVLEPRQCTNFGL